MADLLGGKHPLLPPPIAVNLSGGWNLYFPIPYAKSCKVTCDKGGQYYHVGYRTYPKGTEVKTFSVAQLERLRGEVRELAKQLAAPKYSAGQSGQGTVAVAVGDTIEPGKLIVVSGESGGHAVKSMRLRVEKSGMPIEQALRGIVVQMNFDGEQTVETPLGDFFGAAPAVNQFVSLPLSVLLNDDMYCNWVMPFQRNAEIRLLNQTNSSVSVRGQVFFEPYNWTLSSMYFHAKWKSEFDVPTRPMRDWNYLTAKGKGVFGGVAFSIDNPAKDWWGEGDEKIYVDGETFPSHFGTGTEDYYGYGWGSPKLFTHAYHSQSRCDGPGNYGRTSLNRFHILDRIPFTKDFKFDMELWHWKDCKVNMAVTAYWYALPGATDEFPPIKPEQLVVRPMPKYEIPHVAGAIEGESMRIVKSTGMPEPQDWDGDSGGRHLWWQGGQKPGDELRLEFDVPEGR